MKKVIFHLVAFSIIAIILLGTNVSSIAQTPGLIYKPATNGGNKILDPNGDGYISLNNKGFPATNTDEGAAFSEIPYKPFPVFMDEPLSDLSTGAKYGHTDYAPKGTGSSPLAAYFDGTNFLFRIRLGGQSTASKGYSILIDANNTLNSTGKNPGFEYEVVLATNFDVRVYYHGSNVNANPVVNAAGPIIFNGSVDQYSQKSVASSVGGGDPDYFYDFYVPISAFTGAIPITSTTSLRMTGVTVTSAQSGLFGVASDIGGVDDTKYNGNLVGALKDIIGSTTAETPTVIKDNGFSLVKATAPTVNSPIYTNSATITGTSIESSGSVITIYRNGSSIGTATVDANGAWSFPVAGITLAAGAQITATVTPSGKSVSALSSPVSVQQASGSGGCSTQPPVVTALTNSDKDFTVSLSSPGTITIYYVDNGATINYGYYVASVSGTHIITVDNSVLNYPKPTNGKFPTGQYHFTLTAANGGCTSDNSNSLCSSSGTTLSTPTISPASITSSTATITVTGPSGSTLILTKNGIQVGSATLGTSPNTTSTVWTIDLTGLVNGDVLQARATKQETSGSCTSTISSGYSNAVPVTVTSAIPTITGTYCGRTTTVYGTSTEAAGTEIRIYRNGVLVTSPSGPHAYVNSAGQWTATGFTTLLGGESISATAKAISKAESSQSSSLTIGTAYVPSVLSINSSPAVMEGNTSVSGRAPAGSIVTLYINGEPYRDNSGNLAPVTAQAGDVWTINNISPFELYAGAKLTVRASAPSGTACESASSPEVEVQCKAADQTITTSLSKAMYCPGENATVRLNKSEIGTIYSIYIRTATQTDAQATLFGYSVLGTGNAINLTSYVFSNADHGKVLFVRTIKIGASCQYKIGGDLTVGVYGPVPNNFTLSATNQSGVCPGQSSVITVTNAVVGYSYQLILNNTTKDKIGSPLIPTAAGDISFPALPVSVNTEYGVVITRLEGGCVAENVNSRIISITRTGPTVNQVVTPSSSTICLNNSVSFSFSTQNGYSYSLIEKSTNSQVGATIAGDGTIRTLSTGILSITGSRTYQIQVIGGVCNSNLISEPTVNVTSGPAATVSAGPNQTVCGNTATLQGSNPAPGTGTWTKTSGPSGGSITNATSANTTVTGLVSGTYVFTWTVTTNCTTPTISTASSVTITVNCPAAASVKTTKFIDEYVNGDILAVISDQDGGISSITSTSGLLPSGTSFSIINKEAVLTVSNASALLAGSYTFMTSTIDANSVASNTAMLIRMYDRGTPASPFTPLPVQLAYFTGNVAEGKVYLQWITASEKDNDRFEIERSVDGERFEKIGSVKGNGSSSQMLRYNFTDTRPGAGTVYYRLKQIDFNGKHSYSKSITVLIGKVSSTGLAEAYPNPFSKELNVQVFAPTAGEVKLDLMNTRGQVIHSFKQRVAEGSNNIVLPLNRLSTGLYFLNITGTEINTTLKVLKAQ
ncbi:T9SS type A sorting domain-containing protein [Pontibacter locisalis]|uniref:T9SS type A sorting domain-containing protein n=1 Tax=Pontibacter locisalis TaxID=1719035 RepID=A0ABW5IP37_9BACT